MEQREYSRTWDGRWAELNRQAWSELGATQPAVTTEAYTFAVGPEGASLVEPGRTWSCRLSDR